MALNHQICDECVYICNIQTGKYADGIVVCPGCNDWKYFTFFGAGGGSMQFACRGIDEKEVVIYVPINTTLRISGIKDLQNIMCISCRHPVENWYLKHNKYLQIYFKDKDEPKPKTSKTA